ncbi:UNVERIFIED_CONTAM: hypothetical protein HDU68_011705, partial [Siphonaria sp. JEL0065]
QPALPNPTPLVHALSHAATSNASAFASSALELGKGATSTASTFASNAFGFGLQTFAAAKESLDSKIISLNLVGGKKSVVEWNEKVAAPSQEPHQMRNSISTGGGATSVGILGVVNVANTSGSNSIPPTESTESSPLSPDLIIAQLKRDLEVARKQAADG